MDGIEVAFRYATRTLEQLKGCLLLDESSDVPEFLDVDTWQSHTQHIAGLKQQQHELRKPLTSCKSSMTI